MNTRSSAVVSILNGITALAVLIALYLALVYAPPAANLVGAAQIAQRIFYFHVPSAWVGFLAFFVTFIASIAHLWKGGRRWDILALSSVEIGLVFTTMVVFTGPLWAKPTWGVWWVWADPKLSTVAVLWLIYFAYLMLRNTVEDEARRARLAAVLGIVGFLDVPIVFGAVRWWGQSVAHPIVFGTGGLSASPRMLTAFLFCLGTFTLLYVVLLVQRVRLEGMRHEVERLKSRITHHASRITY
ncbi:MAG: cytochrome c biogenesis protein [Anaerolineae bacterium]